MPDRSVLVLARGGGRDLLLNAEDLREVFPYTAITPLPGRLAGIAGVVLHQGEFLPVLSWEDLPGSSPRVTHTAFAVLKRRLAIPLERLDGTLDLDKSRPLKPAKDDPWAALITCVLKVEGQRVPLLDADKLLALLHQNKVDR